MSMDFTKLKKLSIGGVELKQLFINGVQVWKSGYKNWAHNAIDTDGSIYNGGLGYKEGYRIRSGGAEAEAAYAVCTGFIPFKKGDILRIFPKFSGRNSANALNFANIAFTNIGQYNDSGGMYGICAEDNIWRTGIATEVDGITVIDISAVSNGNDIAYVRLTHALNWGETADDEEVKSGSELIVTVNEDIT